MFNWLQEYLQKTMVEQTPKEDIFALLITLCPFLLIWLIGEIVYSLELKYEKRKHKTK